MNEIMSILTSKIKHILWFCKIKCWKSCAIRVNKSPYLTAKSVEVGISVINLTEFSVKTDGKTLSTSNYCQLLITLIKRNKPYWSKKFSAFITKIYFRSSNFEYFKICFSLKLFKKYSHEDINKIRKTWENFWMENRPASYF